jgi:hypothetical protein
MPYGIPKAWSPSLAIPQYIKDEGLQRHAFTTLEAPDGTYDNPPVGSGNYVVPQYVLNDGYGQGATGTKWAPRGTYYGPKIPSWLSKPGNRVVAQQQLPAGATQFTVKNAASSTTRGVGVISALQGLGADSIPNEGMHPSYVAYGQNAATHLMNSVKKLAPANRKPALKKILDTVDKSLWPRTSTIANRYLAQGVPPAQALHAGLARAMATGFAAEIIHTGMKAQKPKARSLMGLGAYGHRAIYSALGNVALPNAVFLPQQGTQTVTSIGPAVTDARLGVCDATGTHITDVASDGSIYWRALKVGEVCRAQSAFTMTVGVNELTGSGASGGVTVTDTATGAVQTSGAGQSQAVVADPNAQVLQVGPFNIPLNVSRWDVRWSGKLPTDWQAFILPELTTDCKNCAITSMENATDGHPMANLWAFFDDPGGGFPTLVNKDLVGYQQQNVGGATSAGQSSFFTGKATADASGNSYTVREPNQPIVMVTRPDSNDAWGVFMTFEPTDNTKLWDSTTNPMILVLRFLKNPMGVWDWIKRLLGVILDVIGDALKGLGSLACSVLQTPAGVVGGAVVGGYVGGPTGAAAGIKGAQIGAAACAGPPPPVVAPTTSLLLPLALFGGGILIVTLMSKHNKTKKPGHGTTARTTRK